VTRPLHPPPGTRFPGPGDKKVAFEPRPPLRGRVDFEEILEYHAPAERQFTLLGVYESEISAAACFAVRASDVFIDYLVRNDLLRPSAFVPAGSVLVAAIEGFAEQLGMRELRLESVEAPATRAWYERQGFTADGAPRAEAGWGMLYPMVKRVERFAAP